MKEVKRIIEDFITEEDGLTADPILPFIVGIILAVIVGAIRWAA